MKTNKKKVSKKWIFKKKLQKEKGKEERNRGRKVRGVRRNCIVHQMKYSRLQSLTVFCKSMSALKELSRFSGYSFSFVWLLRCACLC